MEKELIYLALAILVISYSIIRYAYLERYATTKPNDVQRISLYNLSLYAKKNPLCTISRRINFFWKIYYKPYTDMLTVKEGKDKNKWGTPYMIFYHKAFRGGKVTITDPQDLTGYLEGQGYYLQKGSFMEE